MSTPLAFALRSTLRAARKLPYQSQARFVLHKRAYASAQGVAHQAAAGSDMPWLVTSTVIAIPSVAYLLMNSPEKKSHDEHHAEAADKHGIQAKKPEEEVGEPHEPKPTSHTDTGDAESKGKTAGSKPEGEQGGSEDSKEGAQPQDKDHKGDESPEKAKNTESRQNKGDGDSPADGSDKKGDKKSADEQKDGGDSGKGTKGQGQMNDSQESQEKQLSGKPDSKRVDPTEK